MSADPILSGVCSCWKPHFCGGNVLPPFLIEYRNVLSDSHFDGVYLLRNTLPPFLVGFVHKGKNLLSQGKFFPLSADPILSGLCSCWKANTLSRKLSFLYGKYGGDYVHLESCRSANFR